MTLIPETFDNQPTPRRNRRARRGPFGCLFRQITIFLVTFAIVFGSCGACYLFAPYAYQGLLATVRSAGVRTYVIVLGVTGNPALKVVTYDADVTATAQVQRDLGALSFLYGEGADVTGTVRISLGADLMHFQYGILACDVDTSSIRTSVGRAPLANSAFEREQIKQQAYELFEKVSAQQAIEKYWSLARSRLRSQFTTWALGLEIPEQPTLTTCPVIGTDSQATATPTESK